MMLWGHGMRCQSRFVHKCWRLPARSANSAARVPERQVRFTEQFFDRLGLLLVRDRLQSVDRG